MSSKSVRIFLVDGSPTGLRTAEIGMSSIKALVAPRTALTSLKSRAEVQKTGVYVLFGDEPGSPLPMIYVGESDDVLARIGNHDAQKEFWTEVMIFVSKDTNLTKAHVRWLESELLKRAEAAKRCTLHNGKGARDEKFELPEADIADLIEFVRQVQLLSSVLGLRVFESPAIAAQVTLPPPLAEVLSPRSAEATVAGAVQEVQSTTTPIEFAFAGNGFSATCFISAGGDFVVRKGSAVRQDEADSLTDSYWSLRRQLLKKGVIRNWLFTQDYPFSSTTAAAQTVSGSTVSGPKSWRHKGTNLTYQDWEKKNLEKK